MQIKDCLPDGAGTCRNEAMIEELRAELAELKATISEAAVLGGVPGETYPATVMALAIHLNDAEGKNEELQADNARLMDDIADAVADAERFKADNARLRAALEAVEWEIFFVDGREYCPWCHRVKENGHKPDCQRQQALERKP